MRSVRLLNGLSSRRRDRLTGGNRGRGLSARVIVKQQTVIIDYVPPLIAVAPPPFMEAAVIAVRPRCDRRR